MKKILFSFVTVLMGILLFSSCANDDVASVDKKADYRASFEKVFGQVNPAQNFNTQRTVTIDASMENVQGNYTLLVYDAKPGKKGASLVGKFENLNAATSASVKVGVSKNTKHIYCVADNGDIRSITSAVVPASGRVTAKFDTEEGTQAEVTEDEVYSVSIAFEDLGSTDDFDFNDAVIKVDYVTGTGVANVTLMAVGAVLPLRLYFTGFDGEEMPLFDGMELHEVMDQPQNTIINTNWNSGKGIKGVDNVPFVTCEIEVPEDFYISEDGAPFMIEVNGTQEQRQITASTEYGAVPQVLVVGKYHSDELAKTFFWRWPKERTRLDLAFPDINNWMANPEDFSFLAGGVEDNLYSYDPTIDDEINNTPEGLEAVDLGLPSGTLWANMNVGATSPEDYGGYYSWGETEEKDVYNWSNYIHYDGGTCHDLGDIAGTEYDVAHVKWGGNWQMPTIDQIQELFDNTTSEWTQVNGVYGRKFTSKASGNSNSIFLPAAGYRWNGNLGNAGSFGYFWSSTQNPWNSNFAYGLHFGSGNADWGSDGRNLGRSVRPVARN